MEINQNIPVADLQGRLLTWFKVRGRDFPWRWKSATNYHKIITEVLLQRTKADSVAKFFPKFIHKYPSWESLYNASRSQLVEDLKPLGLANQRGARLFALAQDLKIRNGIFPVNRFEVDEMSMMGQYIANAYELLILNKRMPLLDVNMSRLLERMFGPRKLVDLRYDNDLQYLAKAIVDTPHAKELNWAILDFAALVCKARRPLCDNCCLNDLCAHQKSVNEQLVA